MIRGIYTAASAMSYNLDAVGVLAHNLSNAGTTGFKRSQLMSESFPALVVQMGQGQSSPLGLGVGAEASVLDRTQGSLHPTGNLMDLALDGPGYFQVRRADGIIETTRNGAFGFDPQKRLMTRDGQLVMGANDKPIQFLDGNETTVKFKDNGDVLENGLLIATLKIVEGQPTTQGLAPQMKPYVTQIEAMGPVKRPTVMQGFLEESNVSIVKEMVGLLSSQKNYDVGQKLIQTSDKMLDKVINEIR